MSSNPRLAFAKLHRYTITSEGATLGYFRLIEDPHGAWFTFAEVEVLLVAQQQDQQLGGNPTCSLCGGPHPFDTTVPSVIWNAVIREQLKQPDYLCLTCIVTAFACLGRSFTAELIGGPFPGGLPIEIQVRGQVAQDAAAISEENTTLRAKLTAQQEQPETAYPWDEVRKECWSQVRSIFREEGPQGEMGVFYRAAPVDNARKLDDEQIQTLRADVSRLTAELGQAYWRGFQQATYNKPGCLTTADELVAANKEVERLTAERNKRRSGGDLERRVKAYISTYDRMVEPTEPAKPLLQELSAEVERLTAILGQRQLFRSGAFTLHSGQATSWKIDCDALIDEDWRTLAAMAVARLPAFGSVMGVPRGGLKFANALQMYVTEGPCVLVDDVLTTGASLQLLRHRDDDIGLVAFARHAPPSWVTALFIDGAALLAEPEPPKKELAREQRASAGLAENP